MSEYYYKIFGYTSRMAKCRGHMFEKTTANAFYLDIETDDFRSTVEKLIESGDNKGVESFVNANAKKYADGLSDFESISEGKYIYLLTKTYDGTPYLYVIIKNFGVTFVKDTHVKLTQELKKLGYTKYKTCMITYKLPTSAFIKGLNDKNQTFMLHSDLEFDPTLHQDVPKHILLNDEEAKQYLLESKLIAKDLRIILRNDRIAKWFGAIPGQIFQVIFKVVNHSIDKSNNHSSIMYSEYCIVA